MKFNAVVRIILFSLIILILGGCLAGCLAGSLLFHQFRIADYFWNGVRPSVVVDNNTAHSGAIPAEQVSELDIQWVAGSITIQPGDSNEISFSETANGANPMVWRHDGHKLVLEFCEDRWKPFDGWDRNWKRKDLVITVPREWVADEVNIEAVYADVEISDLSMQELDLNTVSGKADLSGCTVDAVSLESVSGDIQFDGSLGKLEVDAVSANCTVSLTEAPQKISMQSISGDMELTLPENCGFSVTMENLKSDLNTDFAVSKNGRIYTSGDASCKIEVSGMSGDVTILKAVS